MSGVTADVLQVLADHLEDPSTGWSVGTFGAIAEFTRDPNEPVAIERSGGALSAVTARGGIRLEPGRGLRLVASEGVTGESWSQRVALCLPAERAAMSRRDVLTELGPDAGALREADRPAIMFDLGLGAAQVDACVRVADGALAEQLRACCGRPAFSHDNPAMGLILAASPHRVFISRVGRAEVFQPIPPPDGKSPEGPHTHVLPKLLRHGRTHAATEPVPDGFVPCAHFYPAHPVKDAMGFSKPYDAQHFHAFDRLMSAFGDGGLAMLKRQVAAAVAAGEDPASFPRPSGRFGRAAIRIGLRQLLAAQGPSAALAAWLAVHDRREVHDPDIEDAAAGVH